MALSLEGIVLIDAIERNGSFSKAALELHKVRSALTYAVKKLERDLEIRIFERVGRQAKLTAAGRLLLNQGRRLLQESIALENQLKEVASGWEPVLNIAYNDLIPFDVIARLLDAFYQVAPQVAIKITTERLSGAWDAIASGRVALSIGVSGEMSGAAGIATSDLCQIPFCFVMSPQHPLATLKEPLTNKDIIRYRSIAALDTSLNLPPLTSGIIAGQDILTVDSLYNKLQAHIAGLGVGFFPKTWVLPYLESGELVERKVSQQKPFAHLYLAWQTKSMGKGLRWFVDTLKKRKHAILNFS